MTRYASRTTSGCRHEENQDRLIADPEHGVFIVVDGMGGLADAAATAQLVVDEFSGRMRSSVSSSRKSDLPRTITAVMGDLNEQIRLTARCGPGTTGAAIALVLVRDGSALIVHLGDSRVYLFRGGALDRLTEDHVREGQLARFLGMPGEVLPGISIRELGVGDRLLLCTDGLTAGVQDDALAALLNEPRDLQEVCDLLVDAAAVAETIDDVSVIVLEYEPEGGREDGLALGR